MEEETPLERLQRMDPVSRHEVHGMLEGRLEALWEACNARITSWGGLETNMLDAPRIQTALDRLNEHAGQVITEYTTPRQ